MASKREITKVEEGMVSWWKQQSIWTLLAAATAAIVLLSWMLRRRPSGGGRKQSHLQQVDDDDDDHDHQEFPSLLPTDGDEAESTAAPRRRTRRETELGSDESEMAKTGLKERFKVKPRGFMNTTTTKN